jgi:hypothetical protein
LSKEFLRGEADMSFACTIGEKQIIGWWGIKCDVVIKCWDRIYVAILGSNESVGTFKTCGFSFWEEKFVRTTIGKGCE